MKQKNYVKNAARQSTCETRSSVNPVRWKWAVAATLILSSCAGAPPKHPGVTGGHLAPCPDKPNCVVSHTPDDADHYVTPIAYTGDRKAAHDRLIQVINTLPRTRITVEKPNYIHAEFTSAVFRFVDDVEFYFPDEPVIHVRSASRLGYSDFGVNRNRIEKIRELFNTRK